jgi:tape measure domain-containing protein
MDTALRIVAKVSGLNEFKALTDSLQNVEGASKNAGSGLQQTANESNRVSQEASKTAATVKAQAVALQNLQSSTRASAAEMRRMGGDTAMLGGAVQKLRGQSVGVFDGLSGSAVSASNNIRELQVSLKATDADIMRSRQKQLELAAASSISERSLQQLGNELKNLRSQAALGGAAYQELGRDIKRLQEITKEATTAATEPGIRGLKMLAKVSQETTNQQQSHMAKLKGALATAGEGYQTLGREIDSLRQKAAGLDLSKGLNITPGNVASGVGGAVQSIVQLRRDLANSMAGRVVLTGEGLAATGVAGAAGAGVASGLGGIAGGAQAIAGTLDAIAAKAAALPGVLKPLGGLLADPAAAAAAGVAQWSASLSSAQAKLAALSAPFEAIGTAISAIGPEASAAAGVASLAIAGVYQVLSRQADEAQADLERSFRGISDEAQKVLQNLVRIYDKVPNARLEAQQQLRDQNLQRLGEVPADSAEARRAANAVVSAEREIAKIQAEKNGLIETARQRQNAVADALQRQVQAGREKVNAAREELNFAERINQVQRSATDRRRQAMVAAEQEDLRRRAAEAFAPSRVLALPAAGGSSFAGTVNAAGLGGGARTRLQNFETAGTRDDIGAAMASRSAQAMQQQAQATQRTRGALAELFLTIDRVTKASNGSINSLQRQRSAWQALQNAVNPAAPAYAKATAQVQRLDQQLIKLTGTQEKAERASIGREAIGGALGTLATGGGLQGAVGALAGGLAFSGGAGGIVAGAGVAAIGGAAALASRVGVEAETAQVRLKALTDQFGEYNQAQASAARIAATLRISQVEASDGFSKLYAALRPTGITLQEVEDAFVGFTAAARASGATAQESSFALQQLKQALGAGVLQGDELRSIREQAPAVGQAIAKEMGVTVGELKKLGEQGKITTDIVIRALAKLRGEKLGQLQEQFNTSAQAVKDLQVATQNFGLTVARVFGPSTVAAIRGVTAALEAANQTFGAMTGSQGAQQAIQDRLRARQQAERDTNARPFGLLDFGGRQQFFRQREEQLFQQFQQQRTTSPDAVSPTQQQARDAAAGERNAARARAAAEEGKKSAKEAKDSENDLAKIRLDSERRLAEFREQSIKRAGELEKDLARQRLDLERSTAEARRQIENQRRDAELETRRQQLSAAGLSTAGIDERRLINEERQRFTERQLQIEERATDRKVEIERAVEDYKVSVAEGIRDILVDASEKMAENMQRGAAMAGGVIARTGNTGQSTGPHLDARWSDGRRISAADADRYLSVNGRNPSSFGVTSGYGPRSLFGRSFHKGIDFGTPSGSGISLKGGASLLRDLGFTGAGGYAVEIDTPQGRMRLLHLQAGSAARPSGAPARASAAIATGPAPGMDRIEGARRDLMAALGQNTAAQTGANFGELIGGNSFISRITGDLDQQKASAKEQLADFQRMVELQRSGLSPEIAKQRVDLERMAEIESARLSERKKEIEDQLNITGLTAENRRLLEGQLATVQARLAAQPGIIDGLTAEQQQLERLQASYERNKQLADGVAGTIGGGLSSAMNVLIEGTDNWGNSLREIASGVLQDIAKQLVQILVVEQAISAIRGVIGSLLPVPGGGAGGGLNIADMQRYSNFATGGIMSPSGPLPLKTYARGGIANSPQLALFGEGSMNEAYVPLPDGRRIPVALQGGNSGATTNVVINVDASGTKASGDPGAGNALARDLAAVVDARLLHHKRPGGILA